MPAQTISRRRGTITRSLTTSEQRELRQQAQHFQAAPPWSDTAHKANDAFRVTLINLYDQGVHVEDLARTINWPEERVRANLRKARAAGHGRSVREHIIPEANPAYRKLLNKERTIAREKLAAARSRRTDREAAEIALLNTVHAILDEVTITAIAEYLELPESVLRLRMKTLGIGRFRTPDQHRLLTTGEQRDLALAKTAYLDAMQSQKAAELELATYLKTLTESSVSQGTLATTLEVTRQSVSEWIRKAEPEKALPVVSTTSTALQQSDARTIRRRYRSLPLNEVHGVNWKSDKGRALADYLWALRTQGVPLATLAKTLRLPPSVLGKMISLYRTS